LPHGEYLPWVEQNMPINRIQCAKYIRLAKNRPELLSNVHSNVHLDIDSELKLLSLEDDNQDEIRTTALDLELTQKQINDLTNAVKKGEQTAEEWRQQYLSERDKKRALEKQAESQVDKAVSEAIKAEREATQAQIEAQKKAVEKAKADLAKAKKAHKNEINDKVKMKLGQMQVEIDQKQYAINQLDKNIAELKQKEEVLNKQVGAELRHEKAISGVKAAIDRVYISVFDIMDNEDFDVGEKTNGKWGEVAEAVESMAKTIRTIHNKTAKAQLKIVN